MRWERCPHCALPGLFPNVRAAEAPAEREALGRRYRRALQVAIGRGAAEKVAHFEEAAASSKAVMARPARELDRLVSSDRELIPSYYGLLAGQMRLPHGNEWDGMRGIADEALFPGYKEHIRFAALSIDGRGLSSYGECFFVLRDRMIGHRASVYEENSAISLKKHDYEPPRGHRATWSERARLCVAKLAGRIRVTTTRDQFSHLLLHAGRSSREDSFVEVHVWGPMTIRTIGRILVGKQRRPAARKALRDRLNGFGVELEEIG
ncbi:MAG TPA: hypothetical protein VF414_00380 [Thermoanaerobaculia bacterium]